MSKDLKIQRILPNARLPEYKKEGDSGMDLYVCLEENYVLQPMERRVFDTGLRFRIPEGHEIQIRPRSGMASEEGITVINSPGTIDRNFLGSVKIAVINLSKEEKTIKHHDRIAQAVLAPVVRANIIEVDEIPIDTDRGEGGFGSTD